MLSITHLKTGTKITMEGQPYEVLSYQHSKMGRGGAVVRTKLRNLMTGATLDKTFQGSDKIEEASLAHKDATYLYRDGDNFLFMDDTSYEQFPIKASQIGDQSNYLVEGTKTSILYYEDQPINIELPIKMDFKVVDAPPGVKGNTASGATKSVKLETGISVFVPLFIKTGDRVRLDTRTGQYIERAS
jgi:elongation factor P